MESRNNFARHLDPAVQKQLKVNYDAIAIDLSLDTQLDWISTVLLNRLYLYRSRGPPDLSGFMEKETLIIGPGEIKTDLSDYQECTLIIADSAIEKHSFAKNPDFIVTDLDSDVLKLEEYAKLGSTLLIHSHADNIEKIIDSIQLLKNRVIPTCQTESLEGITNFGGFTDGDRAAYFSHFLRSPMIWIAGFDFDNPVSKARTDMKRKYRKLTWAKKLLEELQQIRSRKLGNDNITYL